MMEVLNSLGPVEVEMAIPGRALGGDILRDRGQDWEALGWESLVEGVDFGEVAREVLGAHPAVLHQPGFERGRGHVRRGRPLPWPRGTLCDPRRAIPARFSVITDGLAAAVRLLIACSALRR